MDKDLILSEEKGERKLMVHDSRLMVTYGSWQLMVNGSRLMVQGMKRQNGISKRDQGFFDPILNKG